jgi:ribosomal-protein-alanine acetyltransferase
VIVRRAGADDLVAVADLDWRALHEPFIVGPRIGERRDAFMAVWPGFLEAPTHRLFIAEHEGAIAGFAALRVVVGEAELDGIAVEARLRGAGVGERLLSDVIDALRAEGVARIVLEVRSRNAAARRLYERLGFAEEGLRRRYYESGDDAVLYGLVLGT